MSESDAAVVREALTDERLRELRTRRAKGLGPSNQESAQLADALAELLELRALLAAADERCVMSPTCVFGTRDE